MLLSSKPRRSKQRQVILEELRRVKTHPTADAVYDMVRRRLPRISLGTVYRNLGSLSRSGEVLKLEVAGTQKRFDGNPSLHYHVRCVECGRVDDLSGELVTDIEERVHEVTDYEILGHRLEFFGLCPKCQEQRKATVRGGSKTTRRRKEG